MAAHAWSVAEAKGHFSDLLRQVDVAGPQVITRRGEEIAVVVSLDEWRRKTSRSGTLAGFLSRSPLAGSGLEVTRDAEEPREVGW